MKTYIFEHWFVSVSFRASISTEPSVKALQRKHLISNSFKTKTHMTHPVTPVNQTCHFFFCCLIIISANIFRASCLLECPMLVLSKVEVNYKKTLNIPYQPLDSVSRVRTTFHHSHIVSLCHTRYIIV